MKLAKFNAKEYDPERYARVKEEQDKGAGKPIQTHNFNSKLMEVNQ